MENLTRDPSEHFRRSWEQARLSVSRLADFFDAAEYASHENQLFFRPMLTAIDRMIDAKLDQEFAANPFVHWVSFSRHAHFWSSAPCLCLWPEAVDSFTIHDCIETHPGPQYSTKIATFDPRTNESIQNLLRLPVQWERPKEKRRGRRHNGGTD